MSAITPTPPTHCMNDRHHWSVRGSDGSWTAIVNPEPVHPDIDSNSAWRGCRK